MPGFENCFVVDVAPQLGVRQTRLLEGEYVVTKDDVMERVHFADTVARGRDYYTPYRSMLPKEVDGLLVAGRHYSATEAAQKMSREIPPCMSMGQSAGVAAALALSGNMPLRARRAAARSARGCARRAAIRATVPSANAKHDGECRVTSANELPLAGIRVIDFTQVMMGPVATQMLGDYGADVIKIERPPTRRPLAHLVPGRSGRARRAGLLLAQPQQALVVLDLRKPESSAAVMDLIAGADVVVNNFRAGVMERMGLGYDELKTLNPRLIYAVGTGFGLTGPYAHKGGQDVLAQAMSGVMARRSRRERSALGLCRRPSPTIRPACIWCRACCSRCCSGRRPARASSSACRCSTRCSPRRRRKRPRSMMRGCELNWGAMPLSGVFETTDGALVMVGAFKADPVQDIGTALELAGPRRTIRASRRMRCGCENKPALQAMFRERFKTNTTAHWIARLEEQDLLCAPVRTIARGARRRADAINGMIMEAPGAVETVRVVGSPIHMSDAPVDDPHAAGDSSASTPRKCWRSSPQARASRGASDADPASSSRTTSPASRSTGRTC